MTDLKKDLKKALEELRRITETLEASLEQVEDAELRGATWGVEVATTMSTDQYAGDPRFSEAYMEYRRSRLADNTDESRALFGLFRNIAKDAVMLGRSDGWTPDVPLRDSKIES